MSDAPLPARSALRPPGSHNELARRLRIYAEQNHIDVSRLNHRVCTEVIFGTLERAKAKGVIEMYLAKGGMALEIRFGVHARASRDLDIGILSAGPDLVAAFDAVLAVGFDDFTFERPREVRTLSKASTYRFDVKIKYKGRPFGTFPVDLNEATYETAVTIERTGFLTALGLPGPLDVPLLDPYLQLAHKLHGATEPNRSDYTNMRSRDILDVLVMSSSELFEIEFDHLRKVVVAEFARRPSHTVWPPMMAISESWHALLSAEAASMGLPDIDAKRIISRFSSFIAQIEGVNVRQTHEYQFLSLTMNLTGLPPMRDESVLTAYVTDGWRVIHIGQRPGYVDQMLAILERPTTENVSAPPPLPRLQLRLEGKSSPTGLSLRGMIRNETPIPANRVRVFVTAINGIRTFGTITQGDGGFEVIFPIDKEQLRTQRPGFPAVYVEYATDDETKVQQIGRLKSYGPDASQRFTYDGEGLGPSKRIETFTHRHHELEDP